MIFWYSGTGNSYWAASEMARCLGDRLVSIAEANRSGTYEYTPSRGEAVGIVCPVYFWGLPASVRDFLDKLRFTGNRPYTWVLLTCGGSACGAVYAVQKRIEVDWYEEIRMPDNYILLSDIRHRDEIRANLTNARAEIGTVYNCVRRREKISVGKKVVIFSGFISKKAYPAYEKARVTSKFYVNDTCTGCGMCEENCPARAIEMRDGKPVWVKDSCDLCLGCLHRCPARAVQFTKKTEKRGRYIHPIWKEKKEGASPFDI